MNTNQVKGSAKNLAGKAQEKVGRAIGSDKHQAKGLSKQAAGKTQKKAGDLQRAARIATKH